MILLDAKGKRLWDGPVEFAQCVVSSVAIGLDDTIAVGESHVRDERGYVGGVVLLDANGERLRPDPIEVSGESVSSVAFSSSRTIAAGESELLLIDGNPASWRDKLERVANRNLTWAEWRQFFPVTRETKAIYRRTIQAFDLPQHLPEPERDGERQGVGKAKSALPWVTHQYAALPHPQVNDGGVVTPFATPRTGRRILS